MLLVTGTDGTYIVYDLWAYDADGTWSTLVTDLSESPLHALFGTLASDGHTLYSFGGYDSWVGVESNAIYQLDTATLAGVQVGSLNATCIAPQVTYHAGEFLVAGGISTLLQFGAVQGVECITPGPDGTFATAPVDTTSVVEETGQHVYGVASFADGFALAGLQSRDGQTDTYTLAEEAGAVPIAFGKRASEEFLHMSSALAYEGRLYVLAGTLRSPYRAFGSCHDGDRSLYGLIRGRHCCPRVAPLARAWGLMAPSSKQSLSHCRSGPLSRGPERVFDRYIRPMRMHAIP